MEWIELGELVNIRKGTKLIETDNEKGSIRMIMIEDLRNDDNVKYSFSNNKNVLVNKDDVIIAWDGANAGLVGFNLEGALGSTLARIRIKDKKINPTYLGLYLQHNSQEIRNNCTGATIPHVSRNHLVKMKIPLFLMETQNKIVAILDDAQNLIDYRKEQIKLLGDLIASIFYDMFGDPVLNNKGWEVKKLGENINVLTDYHANGSYKILKENVELLNNESYALMIRTTDLEKRNFKDDVKHIDKHAYDFLKKSQVYGGDLIINKIGSAGQVYLMPELNRKVSLGMNQFLLRTNENLKHIYLYTLFNTERGEYMIKSKAKGAVTKTINKKAINDLKIPLPPIQLQNQFAEKVELIESQKQLLEDSLKLLEDNYNSLMQKAFKGDLF